MWRWIGVLHVEASSYRGWGLRGAVNEWDGENTYRLEVQSLSQSALEHHDIAMQIQLSVGRKSQRSPQSSLPPLSRDTMQRVCHVSFSPDARFLLGCGGDGLVYVWDTSTGELVTGKQYAEPSTLGEWTTVKLTGRRPVYEVGRLAGRWRPVLARAKGTAGETSTALEPWTSIPMVVTSLRVEIQMYPRLLH